MILGHVDRRSNLVVLPEHRPQRGRRLGRRRVRPDRRGRVQ